MLLHSPKGAVAIALDYGASLANLWDVLHVNRCRAGTP